MLGSTSQLIIPPISVISRVGGAWWHIGVEIGHEEQQITMWDTLQGAVQKAPPLFTLLKALGSPLINKLITTKQVQWSGFGRHTQVDQTAYHELVPAQGMFRAHLSGD